MQKFAWFLLFTFVLAFAQAFTVEIQPSERICFYEHMKRGERLLIGYQMQDGPDYEIDFTMENPRGTLLDKQVKSMGYEKTYDSDMDGRFTFCFHNVNTGYPAKMLSFYVFRDDAEKVTKQNSLKDPLEKEIAQLKEGLRSIKEEQQYIIVRERIHRNTAESTNSRVVWWSLIQTAIICAACYWQVWYIMRFFEVKRSV